MCNISLQNECLRSESLQNDEKIDKVQHLRIEKRRNEKWPHEFK